IKDANLDLPDKPILELLESKDYNYPNLLPCVKHIVTTEYQSQYSGKNGTGNILSLNAFTDADWKKFLSTIDWKFGEVAETETHQMALDRIKSCKYFNHTLDGKEEDILSSLMDLLDKR